MKDDKIALTTERAKLIEQLARPALPPIDRVRLQGELSVINARIKALNTTSAARDKAAADRKRAAGMAEAQANAARARANVGLEDDPGLASIIDAWFLHVLAMGGMRAGIGDLPVAPTQLAIYLQDDPHMAASPTKIFGILNALRDGIHAACRGEELPEIEPMPEERRANIERAAKPAAKKRRA